MRRWWALLQTFFLLLSHEKWKRKAFATKTTPHSPPGLRSPIPWWHYAVFVAPCLVQTLCYSGKRVKNGELSIANAIMIPELKKWSFQENLIYSYIMLIANPFQNLNSNYLSILLCSYITIDTIISPIFYIQPRFHKTNSQILPYNGMQMLLLQHSIRVSAPHLLQIWNRRSFPQMQ